MYHFAVVGTSFEYQPPNLIAWCQQVLLPLNGRGSGRSYHLSGVLVEGHHNRLQPALASLVHQTANHKLMATVYAVKESYSGNASVHLSIEGL